MTDSPSVPHLWHSRKAGERAEVFVLRQFAVVFKANPDKQTYQTITLIDNILNRFLGPVFLADTYGRRSSRGVKTFYTVFGKNP